MRVAPRSTTSRGRTGGALSRQRVDALLDQIWNYRLTLVVAPAGSGKTTALRQFAVRSAPVAWCSAEQLETSPDGCLAQIARLVGEAIGEPLDGSSSGALAAGINAWSGERVALVIDDLHSIASTMAESELGRLIDRHPSKLVVAAGTRSQPEFDISRLLLDDELLEITAEDLRFRTWEADRLFREHYDMILGPTDVAMLITRTEGWAAGLQLYNLAARNQPLDVRRRLIGELGSNRLGRDYLARNVLAGLPADLQSFLIDTSALPVLTGPLCDKVTGRTDSAAVLEHLEHNQLFTISLDQRGAYRYHEVMRAHLDACLQQRQGADDAIAHHRRVGELLEAEDRIDDALHAYSRAGDWSAVSRLVVHRMAQLPLLGQVADDAWIELVPAPIVENDPYLLLARARERTVNGRFGAAMRDYERAIAGAAIETLARTCAEERAVLAGWSDAGARAPSGWLGELRRAAEGEVPAGRLTVSVDQLAVADPAELAALLGRGLALLVGNQPAAAEALLAELVRHHLADSRSAAIAEFGLLVAEGLRAVNERGEPSHPSRTEAVASVVERCGLGWVARMTRASLAFTSQGDGCDAARAVHDDCERDADPWGAALALMFEACGRLLHRDDAAPAFDLAAKAFTELGANAMVDLVAQLRGEGVTSTIDAASTHESAAASVRCFDSLQIVIDDTPVDLSAVRPRALSVLRLLAFHAGRPVHREVLMESLWPEVDPDAALHSLQVAVSSLRKVMPMGSVACIARRGDTYQLELSGDAFFDIRAFRGWTGTAATALAQGDHRRAFEDACRAVDAYRGDLLLDEGPAEWVVGHRDVLRQEMVRACAIAAEAAIKLGMPGDAARLSERGLAVDRYADALWRLQIDALEQSSDKASAERVRRSWQEMMEDLGVA